MSVTGFCAACGEQTIPCRIESGGRCRTEHFRDSVVIMLPTIGEKCLLGRRRRRHGAVLGPGRLPLEPGRDDRDSCAREVRGGRQTAVRELPLDAAGPYPSSLMIGLI